MQPASAIATFRKQLEQALALPTRHTATRPEFAPELSYGRHAGPVPPGVRAGAVLVLLFPVPDDKARYDWRLVLTVRTDQLPTHAGQVSFPGGGIEPGETPEQAAIREFEEELGRLPSCDIVGSLPDVYVYASNFCVTPVVAIARDRPKYVPNPEEVAQVLELPLAWLADRGRRGCHEVIRGPIRFLAPHFSLAGREIWGATWIMLGELWERIEIQEPTQSVML